MRANRTKPVAAEAASKPAPLRPARRGTAVLLVALLAGLGMGIPLLLQTGKASPWMASVRLTVHDMDGLNLPETLEKSVHEARSETAIGRAVDLLQLDRDAEFAGSGSSWLSVAYEILNGAEDGSTDPRRRAIRTLSRQSAIELDPARREARLLVRAASPEKAMKIAEGMATVYAAATEVTGAIPEKETMQTLERAEAALAEFRSTAGSEKLTAVLEKRNQLKALDESRASLLADPAVDVELKDATINDVVSGRLGAAASDDQLAMLGKAYTDASVQLSALAVSLGPKHPRLLAAQGEVEKARSALQARLKLLRSRSLEQAKNREKMLAGLADQRKQLLDAIAASGIDLNRYDTLVAAVRSARDEGRRPADAERRNLPVYEASVPDAIPATPSGWPLWQMLGGAFSGIGAGLAFLHSRKPASPRTSAARREPGSGPHLAVATASPSPDAQGSARTVRLPERPSEAPKPVARSHSAANAMSDAGRTPVFPAAEPRLAPGNPSPMPTVEKLRRIAPHLFEAKDDEMEVERIREELASLRRRVLVSSGRRI